MTERTDPGSHSPSHLAMAGGAEFDAIRALLARWGPLAEGIGDDAALLVPPPGETLVLSTDSCLEDVHFREGWLTAEEIGARAAAAALSDLAAMGARALAVLVSLEVPPAWRARLPQVADGIGAIVAGADARIVGGNISGGARFGVTLTVVGATRQPVQRRGAKVGDALWVTGALGGPKRALDAWERGAIPSDSDRARFAGPLPRLREGAWLAAVGAHAMLDVSDGVFADAGHLAAASGVCCTLWPEAIPRVEGGSEDDALASGEEYELLVATDPDLDAHGFARRFGVPLTRIGRVEAVPEGGAPGVRLAAREASPDSGDAPARVDLPAGHDHFSR
jgi:thiamine-monophosphate kinase